LAAVFAASGVLENRPRFAGSQLNIPSIVGVVTLANVIAAGTKRMLDGSGFIRHAE